MIVFTYAGVANDTTAIVTVEDTGNAFDVHYSISRVDGSFSCGVTPLDEFMSSYVEDFTDHLSDEQMKEIESFLPINI